MHNKQRARLKRIDVLYSYIAKNSPVLIGNIIRDFDHISRRTLQEYLRLLHSQNKILYSTDGWYVPQKPKRQKDLIKNIFHRK
jgi:hypothetical protein